MDYSRHFTLSEGAMSSISSIYIFLFLLFFQKWKEKKKKKIPPHVVLLIAIPIGRHTQSSEEILMFLGAQLIIIIPSHSNFQIQLFSNFLLGANVHPPERKPPPQPPPLGPPAMWPHSGCVKIGSCIPPLVPFLDLCIFALIRKLWGENPKRQVAGEILNKWRQLSPHSPLRPNHLHLLPLSSPTYPDLIPWSPWWCGGERWPLFSLFWGQVTCRHISENFFFEKMDLPLPWFCSSFWKMKNCFDQFWNLLNWQWYSCGRVGHHLGSMVVWGLSWEVGCNGRRMALKLVGKTILVSMVTNHSHQTLPITIKPAHLVGSRMESTARWCSCREGECNGWNLDSKIFRGIA